MVSKEIKETIQITIDEVFEKMNRIAWIDRQKVMTDEVFKNTEKLLYSFNALKEHVADEEEYLDIATHKKSGSFVRYSKYKAPAPEDDQILKDRKDSYNRSKSDCDRIEKALKKIKDKKGYKVIELRYLTKNPSGEVYTFEQIAEMLAGTGEFTDTLTERTVRNIKNKLIKELAVLLFGSDAI